MASEIKTAGVYLFEPAEIQSTKYWYTVLVDQQGQPLELDPNNLPPGIREANIETMRNGIKFVEKAVENCNYEAMSVGVLEFPNPLGEKIRYVVKSVIAANEDAKKRK